MANPSQTLSELLTRPEVHDLVTLPARKMAGGGDPVDVDITFFIYLGIFLVVWMVLKPLLFDPYLKVREARDSGIGGSRDEAVALRREAEEKNARYEDALKDARNDAARRRDALKAEGSAEESKLVGEAREAADKKLSAHREKMGKQVAEARKELQVQADQLSTVIVERLLPS